MHACIEKAIKKTPIYSPQQYYVLARTAKRTGQMYEVMEMSPDSFLDFKTLADEFATNWKINHQDEIVTWINIRVFQVQKAAKKIVFYKTTYDGDFKAIDLLRVRTRRARPARDINISDINLSPVSDKEIPLAKAKYDDLVWLCQKNVVPHQYHQFFENLPHAAGVPGTCK